MGKREPVALLNLSTWCLVMIERLFLAVPWGCLQFVIVVFPDHTHLLFLSYDVKSRSEIAPCNKIDKTTRGLQILRKRYDVHNNIAYIMTKS